jgi:hypothetical protein
MQEAKSFREGNIFSYQIFNVLGALGTMRLDEWKGKRKTRNKTIQEITDATNKYLQLEAVQKGLRKTTAMLVESRQRRSKTVWWESFCIGSATEPADSDTVKGKQRAK